jgi:simple sugar transport system permease protein
VSEGAFLAAVGFAAQTVRISVPYTLAAVGATFSERGGVVNIALEGMLLGGAFAAVLGTYVSGNPWIGALAALGGGVLAALLHAIVSITFKADQIISGVALNLLAIGVTKFLLKLVFGSSSNSSRVPGLNDTIPAPLAHAPILGLLATNSLVVLTVLIVALAHLVLFHTRFGLRLRAVGEHPEAADTAGLSVSGLRYAGVLISGLLAGLGGAWLAFDQHSFTDGMSSGRGYIALAAMIVGKWTPLGAAAACVLFAVAETLQIRLQGGHIPAQFLQMLPYLATMIALAGVIGRATPPAADGVPYRKEGQ